MSEKLPDRLSNDPDSPFHDRELLERGVGIRFNGAGKDQCRGILRERGLDSRRRGQDGGPPRQAHDHQAQGRRSSLICATLRADCPALARNGMPASRPSTITPARLRRDRRKSRGPRVVNVSSNRYPTTKLAKPQITFTSGDDNPLPGGLAKGDWNFSPEIPATKCGTPLARNAPARNGGAGASFVSFVARLILRVGAASG